MEENENGRVASPDHLQDFQLFFFCSAQILFYLPTCFFLWTMKPSKRESTLYGKIFSKGGGGGGAGGGGERGGKGINYYC